MNSPIMVFILSFVAMALAALIGDELRKRIGAIKEEERDDFKLVVGATLTLLGLIIGFSFSMAISHYDQRRNYEEAEANSIGTEYLRADLLPEADAAKVRALLKKYVDLRISFFNTLDARQLEKVNADTAELQNQLWSAVHLAPAPQTPVVALAVSGMNDVLTAQGSTQATWWNRMPIPAWGLMEAIAICCNLLIGYGAHGTDRRLFLIVPIAVSISFFLIADIDSPRGGFIRVVPQNLVSLSQSLRGQ